LKNYMITITRQFGSLGRPIAREMSEILKIEYYDRDIVERTSRELNLSVPVISNTEETANTFFNMKYPLGQGTTQIQDQIYQTQKNIILSLVEKESCIIVGRCADSILAGRKNCLHIYIYAPYEARLDNCINALHMSPDTAKKMIRDVDKARCAYHKCYAGFAPDDVNHKDILLNSALLGQKSSAEVLADLVRRKFGS